VKPRSGSAGLLLEKELEELNRTGRVQISVKVHPGARETAWIGRMADGTLKIAVAAPPEKSKANAELLKFLAREFGVPVSQLELASGATSTRKLIRVRKA